MRIARVFVQNVYTLVNTFQLFVLFENFYQFIAFNLESLQEYYCVSSADLSIKIIPNICFQPNMIGM